MHPPVAAPVTDRATAASSTSPSSLVALAKAVALVGPPNSGKTTLFNWLTGSRFKTVNYPGSTVEYSLGKTHDRYGPQIPVMDTPGTYSLDAKSPDERVTTSALFAHEGFGAAELVISVVDATQLSRHLLLTKQLLESGFEVILAVTMMDLLSERRETMDVAALESELGLRVVLIDGRLGGGVVDLIHLIRARLNPGAIEERSQRSAPFFRPWGPEKLEATLRETARIERQALAPMPVTASAAAADQGGATRLGRSRTAHERTRRLDRILLHPVLGLVVFFVLMASLFSSLFWLAAPAMDWVDGSLSWIAGRINALGSGHLAARFLSDGVIASLAAVLVFVPQIFILFFGIVLLEDSGYLARSATLVDKPLSLLGLGGRSFVPLLSGYACAVPAMMAARTINSRKERLLTLFVVPLMSCSARLPVYALLLAFLFHDGGAWIAGAALAAIYFGSLLVGAIAAAIANRFLTAFETSNDRSFFMLELPVYRMPKLRLVFRQAFARTTNYLRRAGPPIFIFALIIWAGTTFPRYDLEDANERLSASYATRLGKVIEPIFEPMGGDWRTGVGLISAFAAREVFVSSLAVIFHVTEEDEDSMQAGLLNKMREATAPSGYPLFTVATVLGLIVFFMIALQCLSTVMVALKEAGSWRFALLQLGTFNLAAYGLAVAIVQGLRGIGIA